MTDTAWRDVWDWFSTHGFEIIAVALSPIIALQISAKIERDRDEVNQKRWVLQTLMATRHAPFADDRIRALNMVDVLFRDDTTVRNARRDLLISLSKTEGVNPDGTVDKKLSDEWNERQWELVSTMAATLNVCMTKDDFAAGYAPRALNDLSVQQALAAELNKTMIMFARNSLGLRWNPLALYKIDDGVLGPHKEPPPPGTPSSS